MTFRSQSTLRGTPLAVIAVAVAALTAGAPSRAEQNGTEAAGAARLRGNSIAPSQQMAPRAAIHFSVAPTGNDARYRVREQLMGHDLPNDAVGETQEITGGLTLDNSGALVAGQSRFVVGVTSLKSDRDRRDGYVQRRLLETEQYPQVVLVPTALHGVPTGLGVASNAAGPASFELLGDLTVHGVTHPTTWQIVARADGGHVTGTASTRFTFEEFGLTQPRVPIVLSVADTIALEYDFTLARDSSQAP